jgi:Cell Wall Hydrolase
MRHLNLINGLSSFRPALAQAKKRARLIGFSRIYATHQGIFVPEWATRFMVQESIITGTTPPQSVLRKRRRLIGRREVLLVLIAFSLLALAPSFAQISLFGRNTKPATGPVLGQAERAETNFSGSAFYFLEPINAVASRQEAGQYMPGAGVAGGVTAMAAMANEAPLDDPKLPYETPGVGDAARPFIMPAGSADHARALKCLTDAIYYEAATEAEVGQAAVAQVILNRMRHPTYPNTVCGVIYQGSERRTGCQFSYSCDGSMARIPSRLHWDRANRIASAALSGYVYAPVGMATHYHTVAVNPYWAPSLHYISTIGAHRFYRWNGSAGRPSAFYRRYAGNEPFPGPKARAFTPRDYTPTYDPIQLQKQYEREYAAARVKAESDARTAVNSSAGYVGVAPQPYSDIAPSRQKAAPSYAPPVYSAKARNQGGEAAFAGDKLPDTNNIKPEFQGSGTWKSQPTG